MKGEVPPTTRRVFLVIIASYIGTSTCLPWLISCFWLSFVKLPFDKALAFRILDKRLGHRSVLYHSLDLIYDNIKHLRISLFPLSQIPFGAS